MEAITKEILKMDTGVARVFSITIKNSKYKVSGSKANLQAMAIWKHIISYMMDNLNKELSKAKER